VHAQAGRFSNNQCMPELTDTTTLTRMPTVIGTTVGESIVLLDDRDGFLELNPVGAEIWELIEQPMTLGSVVVSLTATFGVDAATVRRDVMPFIQTLLSRNLAIAT
jgi:hypothetical protein